MFLTLHAFGPLSARGFLRRLSALSGGQLAITFRLTTAYRLFLQSSFTGTQTSGCQYCLPARMKKSQRTRDHMKAKASTPYHLACYRSQLCSDPGRESFFAAFTLCIRLSCLNLRNGTWTDDNEKEGRKKGGRACAYLTNLHGKCSLGTCHLAVCLRGGYTKS